MFIIIIHEARVSLKNSSGPEWIGTLSLDATLKVSTFQFPRASQNDVAEVHQSTHSPTTVCSDISISTRDVSIILCPLDRATSLFGRGYGESTRASSYSHSSNLSLRGLNWAVTPLWDYPIEKQVRPSLFQKLAEQLRVICNAKYKQNLYLGKEL